MTQPISNLCQNSRVSTVNQTSTDFSPTNARLSQESSIGQHPDAPKYPSLLSWPFNLIGRFFDWILSWFCKPKKNNEESRSNQEIESSNSFHSRDQGYPQTTECITTEADSKASNTKTLHSELQDQTQKTTITLPSSDQTNITFVTEDLVLKLVAEFKGPIKRGQLKLERIVPTLVFDLDKHDFNETLYLVTGKPFITFADDFVCDYTLMEAGVNSTEIQLPSSVFKNTKIKNHIYFIQKGTLYSLELVGTSVPPRKSFKKKSQKQKPSVVPFDELFAIATGEAKKSGMP